MYEMERANAKFGFKTDNEAPVASGSTSNITISKQSLPTNKTTMPPPGPYLNAAPMNPHHPPKIQLKPNEAATSIDGQKENIQFSSNNTYMMKQSNVNNANQQTGLQRFQQPPTAHMDISHAPKAPPTSFQKLQDNNGLSNTLNVPNPFPSIIPPAALINSTLTRPGTTALSTRERLSLPSTMNQNELEAASKKRGMPQHEETDPNGVGSSKRQNPYQSVKGTTDVPSV